MYSFNGLNGVPNNWLTTPNDVKATVLRTTNQFTLSVWLRVEPTSGSSYIVSFELGNDRYFSLYESSVARMTFYYFRDALPGFSSATDDGYDTQVALSFYYNRTQLPNGLRDNQWHFLSFSVNFPSATLLIDGVEYQPTRGNYRNQFDGPVNFDQVAGVNYSMPAPILEKSDTLINDIGARIGGSIRRNNRHAMFGEMRQMVLSNIVDNNLYACLASCNNIIGGDPNQPFPDFVTFYNPVTRTYDFTGPNNAARYTEFVQSMIYYTNGFLPPQESGERRRITLRINDERGLGSEAQINLIGRSNQEDPVLDVNGDQVDGINFLVDLREDLIEDQELEILSPRSFITDTDIDSVIVSVTVNLTNPQNGNRENIRLLDTPPNLVNVTGADGEVLVAGSSSKVVFIESVDPLRATANVFITVLISLRYTNSAEEPMDLDRIIEYTVFDGLRVNNPRAQTIININTIDDIPVIDLNGPGGGVNQNVRYTESSPPILLTDSLAIVDPDSNRLTAATARIATVFDTDNETLAFDLDMLASDLTCSPSSCNGTEISISGSASLPAYQRLLRTLQYVNLKQLTDLPSLRDRTVFVTVSDGLNSSDPQANILIDFIPLGPRVIIELDAPSQNYSTNFREGQGEVIPCHSLVRAVDTSIDTLESIVVSIRDVLPGGITEDLERISITSTTGLNISIEINTALKRITFSQIANISQYIEAIRRIRYFNGEPEPLLVTRFVDFLVIPGGGAPSDTAVCSITIEGVNDHTPECPAVTDPISVSENSTNGHVIIQLVAMDPDQGRDGELSYQLLNDDDSLIYDVSTDGLLSLTGDFPLDREITPLYFLTVEACDNGSPQLCCQFNLTVMVADINDNPPVFSDPEYTFGINENLAADFAVFRIADEDEERNSMLANVEIDSSSFSVRAGCFDRFGVRLDSENRVILSTSGLDFEVARECFFEIVAYDAGVPSLSGRAMITVRIVDIDDSPPEFITDPFMFIIEEENDFPVVIGAVEANDSDSSILTYSLMGAVGLFEINETTGSVSILFSSDRANATVYTFTATVADPPNNRDTVNNRDTAMVVVNIVPINNDPPVIDLNVTDTESRNALTPVVFVEEGGPVRIATEPFVDDPDELALTIVRITVRVANSGIPENEILKLGTNPTPPPHTILPSSTPGELVIQPQDITDSVDIHNLLQSVVYENTQDELSECENNLYPCLYGSLSRTLLFSVNDGRFESEASEAFVVFQLVNDPPLVDLDESMPGQNFETVFTEGTDGVSIVNVASYSITDEDDLYLLSLTCTLTNPLDSDQDSVFLRSQLPDGLTQNGTDLHQLVIQGNSTIANYEVALGLVEYRSTSANPDTTNRLIEIFVTDASMLVSNVAVTNISFIAVGDQPRLDLDTTSSSVDFSVVFTENGNPVSLSENPVVMDIDSTNMQSLVVTLINGSGPEEVLILNQPLTDLTFSYVYPELSVIGNADTSTYQDIVASIQYQNTADEIASVVDRTAQFVITDTEGLASIPVSTRIAIRTIDDNPPVFTPSDFYNFTVPENSERMTLVDVVMIMDADLPPGQDVPVFTIEASSPPEGFSDFLILTNPDNPSQGQIFVNGPIDYDMRVQRYDLIVVAQSSTRNASARVSISVMNLPDVPPVFDQCPLIYSTIENEDFSTPLTPASCTASDPDNLDVIRYGIEGNIVNANTLITINPMTGELTVVDNINRETIGIQFGVTITATDSTQFTSRNITVVIQGENEHNPAFNRVAYVVTVEENAAPTGSIVTVLATDADEQPDIMADPNFVTRITYRILLVDPPTVAEYFSINSTSGEIAQLLPIDYEMFQQFQLIVGANDNDATTTPRETSVSVTVNVDDVNDELPQFVGLIDPIIVDEDAAVRSTITIIDITDPDSDPSLSISILPPVPSQFLLTAISRVLFVDQPLDAEEPPRVFEITLQLVDSNTDPRYIEASTVLRNTTIIVRDVNDEPPRFSSVEYHGRLVENSPAGMTVLNVTATDNDYGLDPDGNTNGNNRLTYSFLALNAPPPNTFSINTSTGSITTVRPLNREDASRYVFTVVVRDNPSSLTDAFVRTTSVTIDILDINEFPPRPDPALYFAFVPESTPTGQQIPTYAQVSWNISCE